MKIMSWNIGGLNSLHKQDVVHNFVRDHRPDILLVQDSKLSKEKVEKIKMFNFCGVHSNKSEGASGGIVTFWNLNFIRGEPLFESTNHVATKFFHVRDIFCWIQSNIYAPNSRGARKKFQLEIKAFHRKYSNENWIVMGDCNTLI